MALEDRQRAASMQGRAFEEHTKRTLIAQGYEIVHERWREPETLVEIDFVAAKPGAAEVLWIECKGSWESTRNGLQRSDTLKKAIANGYLLSAVKPHNVKYIVVTSDKPRTVIGNKWLDIASGDVIDDVWIASLGFQQLTTAAPSRLPGMELLP